MSTRTEAFITARNLLQSGADAGERIMASYKEVYQFGRLLLFFFFSLIHSHLISIVHVQVNELTGYSRRVYDMFMLFESAKNQQADVDRAAVAAAAAAVTRQPPVATIAKSRTAGRVIELDEEKSIVIDSISVVAPTGDVIVPSLSLRVCSVRTLKTHSHLLLPINASFLLQIEQGMNLLITGPNGCGKSSLLVSVVIHIVYFVRMFC